MTTAEPAPAAVARGLMRRAMTATLATALVDPPWPYASLVEVAVRGDGTPLLLISRLAQHTQNLLRDPRVSLLFDGTGPGPDRLAGPRVTVLGRAEASADPAERRRYLARHPGAARYADFGDFAFYRVAVERAHLVGGFGRIHWIDGSDLLLPAAAAAFLADDSDVVAHMNRDHADAIALYAERLLGLSAGSWRLSGCDPEGCDLTNDGVGARLDFPTPTADRDELRAALAGLARAARASARRA
jgi:putative heme iron utilization protein